MRKVLVSTLFLTLGSVVPSHAIFGIGGHWSPAPTLNVKADSGAIATRGSSSIMLSNGKSSSLQGFGAKVWIDIIPKIDIEAAGNLQFGTYKASISVPNGTGANTVIPIAYDLGIPALPTTPTFLRTNLDVSVLYPFLKLPPLVTIAKVYAGAGLSYGAATEVITAAYAKKALDKGKAANKINPETATPTEIATYLTESATDAAYKKGVGFYLQLGAHVKPPVVPIAIYADAKYQFFSFMPSALEGPSISLELGGALAF